MQDELSEKRMQEKPLFCAIYVYIKTCFYVYETVTETVKGKDGIRIRTSP